MHGTWQHEADGFTETVVPRSAPRVRVDLKRFAASDRLATFIRRSLPKLRAHRGSRNRRLSNAASPRADSATLQCSQAELCQAREKNYVEGVYPNTRAALLCAVYQRGSWVGSDCRHRKLKSQSIAQIEQCQALVFWWEWHQTNHFIDAFWGRPGDFRRPAFKVSCSVGSSQAGAEAPPSSRQHPSTFSSAPVHRSWCRHCVASKGRSHATVPKEEGELLHTGLDSGFFRCEKAKTMFCCLIGVTFRFEFVQMSVFATSEAQNPAGTAARSTDRRQGSASPVEPAARSENWISPMLSAVGPIFCAYSHSFFV